MARKPGGVGLYKSLADLLQERRNTSEQVMRATTQSVIEIEYVCLKARLTPDQLYNVHYVKSFRVMIDIEGRLSQFSIPLIGGRSHRRNGATNPYNLYVWCGNFAYSSGEESWAVVEHWLSRLGSRHFISRLVAVTFNTNVVRKGDGDGHGNQGSNIQKKKWSKSDSEIRPESSLHIGKYSYIQSGINNKGLQEYFVLILGSTIEKAIFTYEGFNI